MDDRTEIGAGSGEPASQSPPAVATPGADDPPQPPWRRWAGWYRTLGGRGRIALATAVTAAAAVIALAVASIAGGTDAAGQTPAAARDFTVPVLGHQGRHISLRELGGKPVIVNFFASWCAPCKRETPLLARYYRSARARGEGLTVIGIDVNDPAAAALRFVRQTGVSYPVGTDTPPRTATSYGVSGLPQTFFLNARHRVVKRVFGALTPRDLAAAGAMISKSAR